MYLPGTEVPNNIIIINSNNYQKRNTPNQLFHVESRIQSLYFISLNNDNICI